MPDNTSPRLRRSLNTVNLTLFGLVAMAPIASITIHGFVAEKSRGAVVPAYLLAGIGVLLTALSFAQMAEAAPSAGSVHGYIGKALGPALGFLGAWAILLDYLLLNVLVIDFGALYLAGAVEMLPIHGLAMAFALYAFLFAVLGISWSARADFLMAGLQALVVLVVVAFGTATLLGGGSETHPAPFWPSSAPLGAAISGAAMAVIAYLGFDAISTLAEEVASTRVGRVVGIATLLSVILMTAVFIVVGWTLSGLAGGLGALDPGEAGLQIVAAFMPGMLLPLGIVCGLALGLGVNLATVTGAARILFSLAREGQLPRPLSLIHPRFRSPWVAVLCVFLICAPLSLIGLNYVDTLAGLVSFGALAGFLLVNLSVIAHYGIAQRSRRWLRDWLLPAAGAAVVLYIISGIGGLALGLGLCWLIAGLLVLQLSLAINRRGGKVLANETIHAPE